MDRWSKLYRKLQNVESEREARERDAAQTRAAFEQWCRSAMESVLQAVVERLQRRGDEFSQHTGVRVVVDAPDRPPVEMGEGGPRMSFVRVSLGSAQVDLYLHREPGGLPILHIVRSQSDPDQPPVSRRVDVIVSTPICVVTRRPDEGWELHRVGASGAVEAGAAVMDVDELVFELFELLVSIHTRATVGHEP